MYQIMAIGNALVDHEFSVTDAQLATTQLKKGNMTLATAQEQQQLLQQLDNLALKPKKMTGGGSAANAMYALASLGGKCHYACRVGDDDEGLFYLQDLKNAGVHTNKQAIYQGGMTGTCVVCITPDGERTMQTHLGTSSDINEHNIDIKQLTDSQWLYLEGYLAMSAHMTTAIDQLRQNAKQHNCKIAVSFADPAVVTFAKSGLNHMLGDGVEVIFCNLEEAQIFTQQTQPHDYIAGLLTHCNIAVVTQGSQNSLIGTKDNQDNIQLIEIITPTATQVLDTNGAGDNFAGAFLYGLSQHYDLQDCGKLASHIASQVVQQFGARLASSQYQDIANKVLVI